MNRTLSILLSLFLAACAAPTATQSSAPKAASEGPTRAGQIDLELLASFFTGNWESAPADPPRLIRVAEFWKGGTVRWFYLEWTRPGEARPLRQQVLRIAEGSEPRHLAVTVHRLPGDAAAHAGEWRKEKPFEAFAPKDMPAVEACRMRGLRSMDALYELATAGPRCPGDLAGQPYARHEITMTSADMGLVEKPIDAAGNVPPGSRLDAYVFRRTSRVPR